MPHQFSHHNKFFMNYVFFRKWAVRNPAGTRLDSSLVNKQVDIRDEGGIAGEAGAAGPALPPGLLASWLYWKILESSPPLKS